ncbi:MAG: hypothetical protein Q4P72_04625 [Eubacteriales bacterium]|nr:hypothetical protein [Eubacteriales bacterium]
MSPDTTNSSSFMKQVQMLYSDQRVNSLPLPDYRALRNFSLICLILEDAHLRELHEQIDELGLSASTTLHGRARSLTKRKTFWGRDIEVEKSLVLICVPEPQLDQLMEKLQERAGLNSDIHALIFKLPIEEITGLSHLLSAEAYLQNSDHQNLEEEELVRRYFDLAIYGPEYATELAVHDQETSDDEAAP